jgi:bifunctional non-homologous end joining protein LigD
MRQWTDDPASVRPMLATTAEAPLESPDLVYEPKYDGIRALAAIADHVRLWSRLGNEKTAQFPEIVDALEKWARGLGREVLLDGEVVALDDRGEPCGFQNLQGRIHLKTPHTGASYNTAFIVFDLLRDGAEDLRPLPLRDRRHRLEALLRGVHDSRLRISEQAVGNGRDMHARAKALVWEGLIAKDASSVYKSGRRSPDWRKIKLVRHQTCVVGGWTEPRGSRPFFGALLLGVYDEGGRLQYIGHTGAGFSDAELGRVWKKLQALKTKECPFKTTPRTNERPHWVKPELVAEVKFTEWTADNRLRHPTYLGLRDDVKPEAVRREPDPRPPKRAPVRRAKPSVSQRAKSPVTQTRPAAVAADLHTPARSAGRTSVKSATRPSATTVSGARLTASQVDKLRGQLDEIETRGGDGVIDLPGGDRLEVTNLGKTFWPKLKLTKGDLFRHYVRVAPAMLPILADRPLVLKRYPNGVAAKPFYQHRAPDKLPVGVRVQEVQTDTERRPHFIGGDLKTLLYTAQLAAISQDPWFSRIGSQRVIDHVAIDLDPPDDIPFARVLDVARWVRDELDSLGAPAFPKTSGSRGLHVYVPMPPNTSYDAGLLFCQIVATMVANKHPRAATVERSVAARGRRIYVDYLQNIQGKTLASAYSARANDFAGVSTPLTWEEVDEGVSPTDFTLRTFGERLESVGDLWAAFRKSKGARLEAVTKYAKRT